MNGCQFSLGFVCIGAGDLTQGPMQARQSWFRVSLILSFSHRKVLGKREDLRGAKSSLSIYRKKSSSEESAWGGGA